MLSTPTIRAISRVVSVLIVGIVLVVLIVAAHKAAAALAPQEIPFAATEEARIVCSNFGGLASFTATRNGAETTDGETLTRWQITAKCNSQHTVAGVIGIK